LRCADLYFLKVMSAHLLLVEDDADLCEAMAAALAADGHEVRTAADGDAAQEALAAQEFDIVLLDVALGSGPDGVEVCRRLRQADTAVYVMMVTARDAEADIVLALEAGADDYVTKPVGIAELRSRVRAALRRLAASVPQSVDGDRRLVHGELVLDRAARAVAVGTEPVELTRSEFAILEALLQADGAVRSRAQLLQAIYGDDAYRDPHGIDVHVHHLRSKLDQAGGDGRWVATARGAGYRMA
jgi:DNA-binding response OmpR family regulator